MFFSPEEGVLPGTRSLAGGVATDPAKINQVAQWPVPQSTKEVQKFLGLANYYRQFVRNFASIARPLQ